MTQGVLVLSGLGGSGHAEAWRAEAGVPVRTAQAAMRHSDPSLTAIVYPDPKLLDVAGAVGSLPDLPLGTVGGPAVAVSARQSRDRCIFRPHELWFGEPSTQEAPLQPYNPSRVG